MSNIIHTQQLKNIKPLVWYSKPVYIKYKQIVQILCRDIGSEMEHFLLEPDIKPDALKGEIDAYWYSDKFTRLKPLTQFSEKIQAKLKEELKTKINKILNLSQKLEASEDKDEQEFSEFLKFIIEVPSLDYVYTNGKDLSLACWGFKSIEITNRDFKLSRAIEKKAVDEETIIDRDSNINQEEQTVQYKKPINFKKYLLILLTVLLLGLLGTTLFYFKDKLFGYTEQVVPIDPSKVKIDQSDPAKKKIVINRLTVILDTDNGMNTEKFAKLLKKKFPSNTLTKVYEEPLIGLIEYEVPEDKKEEWIQKLKELDSVLTVDQETIFSTIYTPNDVGFTEEKKKWLFEATNTYNAWNQTMGSEDIIIAVIDGAFDLKHPELKNKNIIKQWNAATGNSKLTKATDKGYLHGTHVASTALGSTDNQLGTGGICPNCSLMPIQVGQENMEGFSSNTIIRSILYAIKNNANIINLSIGRDYGIDFQSLSHNDKVSMKNSIKRSTLLEEVKYERVFQIAKEKNIAIIYAAGNDDMFSDIDPQKRSSDILVVGATTKDSKKSSFSNYGNNVIVSAPGVNIYSAAPNNQYKYLNGTSMASPIVSGAIGLMKSINPTLPNSKIYEILETTGKEVQTDKDNFIGPIIQIDKALKEAKKKYNCEDEVRRLKKELKKYKTEPLEKLPKPTKMHIPRIEPKDFEFAEGLWMSNEPLHNANNPNIEIVLYFDIQKTGEGKLTLKLSEKNEECKAKISLSFSEKILNINQLANANCNKSNSYYSKYHFTCIASANGVATCNARGSTEVTFELIKIEN